MRVESTIMGTWDVLWNPERLTGPEKEGERCASSGL